MRASSFIWIAASLLVGSSFAADAQESENFVMDRVSITAAATRASSGSFDTTVLIAQESVSGAASVCNDSFVGSFGYWSVLGDLPVPIVLRLNKGPGSEPILDLSWTGSDDVFQVYRSASPTDILDPVNLLQETPSCATDDAAAMADLLFYRVIPKQVE